MNIDDLILTRFQAEKVRKTEHVQSLWSGYGSIDRYAVEGSSPGSVIVKHVRPGAAGGHPRGWDNDLSHERKLRSYEVESRWYEYWSSRCDEHCRVPFCYELRQEKGELLFVMEDLDDAGYPGRRSSASRQDVDACLSWLAHFHALFMDEAPEGLWPVGTYWHLETRPGELKVLNDRALKKAAPLIDRKLNAARYKTIVHGDAKLANFCFSEGSGTRAAAVDFQYVGGGVGVKDLAYFIGSCFYEEDCARLEQELLDTYFVLLKQGLSFYGKQIDGDAVEEEWRELFSWAWTDFHRFLKGWSPGHWKINSYSEVLAARVLEEL